MTRDVFDFLYAPPSFLARKLVEVVAEGPLCFACLRAVRLSPLHGSLKLDRTFHEPGYIGDSMRRIDRGDDNSETNVTVCAGN